MDATSARKLDTSGLKKFAQAARRTLIEQVSVKLKQVLAEGSAARREQPQAVKELEGQIAGHGRDEVVERVAYTWFNRLSALRFMDANGYTRMRMVSPGEGQTRPEILAEAVAGHVNEDVPQPIRERVSALLEGRSPSRDPQAESYRLLLVASCNAWHGAMPFLFEKIADYTELLMPDDLLSADSILAQMREVMSEEACRDVEIIGWLYQFYISEKKDEVFAGLKKNKKITPENIPAATQLFTPHWIVRYLVENSLGRLWMLNRPTSRLRERMDYYLAPETPEDDFLRISSPDEIRVCDPACGSGHMLTYAFDLLYAIYEEEGHDPAEIPEKILTHNLYGIEIDDRAGALAAFALVMKAAGRRKRFLRRPVQPNICVLENVSFQEGELADYVAQVGHDLLTDALRETLGQFDQAKNFGSLIVPKLRDVAEATRVIAAKDFAGDMLYGDVHARVQCVLRMADYLSPKYHVVVANPPYMGSGGMNSNLSAWVKSNYNDAKSDLMTCFMRRSSSLLQRDGYWGMINLPSWLYLSSFEHLRDFLVSKQTICSLIHLGRGIFGSDFGTVAFTIRNIQPTKTSTATYRKLYDKHVEVRKPEEIRDLFLTKDQGKFVTRQSSFEKIRGKPLAYSASEAVFSAFSGETLADQFVSDGSLKTGDNTKYIRFHWEVSSRNRSLNGPWRDHPKGGEFRKWSGNRECIVRWDFNAISHYQKDFIARILDKKYWNIEGISWSAVTSGQPSFRKLDFDDIANNAALCIFPKNSGNLHSALGYLNSKLGSFFIGFRTQTLNFLVGDVMGCPALPKVASLVDLNSIRCVESSKSDWDAFETSWDFTTLPLLDPAHRQPSLAQTYAELRAHWQRMTSQMQRLEEENNRIFIDAYGLQEELTPEVPLEEITLTCNPAYRYGGKKTDAELEDNLRADTMREFVSYAVGCMFGRYSLDAPGLILANQGDGMTEYLACAPNPTFAPDADNVIPILDGDWFADDITERFRKFLRVTFGEARFAENLAFIESALGKDLRRYFLRDFYDDHLRRYKKRPIYWLFSSPKGSFNALIYMHRYRPDTAGVVLNGYLREYRNKLAAHRAQLEAVSISADASQAERTRALKEIESLGKMIDELDAYERDVLYPLATQRIEIDLDDGVKVNYARFGSALKPIKGLNDLDK